MSKKQKLISGIVLGVLAVVFLVAALLVGGHGESESLSELMRDAVLHETNHISLFGVLEVNPGLIGAFMCTAGIIVVALLIRIIAIPRFKKIPGRFQAALEYIVGLFDGLAKGSSPHRNRFLGAYAFTAGVYIFVSTIFELFGVQMTATNGHTVALPAPLSDINGAIAMAVMTYLAIMSGGIASNGIKGVGMTLKDFSLPISMSFRLFGALLSGALVTELVYYSVGLSIVLPVVVGVLFTLIHALIQAYVLTMLCTLFYGEVSEVSPKKNKKAKQIKEKAAA